MIRAWRYSVVAALCCYALPAFACNGQTAWVELRVSAPEASKLGARVIGIDREGCTEAYFPLQDRRHGSWVGRNNPALADRLAIALKVLRFDQSRLDWVSNRHAESGTGAARALSVDGESRTLIWSADGHTQQLRTPSLAFLRKAAAGSSEIAALLGVVELIEARAQPSTLQRVPD